MDGPSLTGVMTTFSVVDEAMPSGSTTTTVRTFSPNRSCIVLRVMVSAPVTFSPVTDTSVSFIRYHLSSESPCSSSSTYGLRSTVHEPESSSLVCAGRLLANTGACAGVMTVMCRDALVPPRVTFRYPSAGAA